MPIQLPPDILEQAQNYNPQQQSQGGGGAISLPPDILQQAQSYNPQQQGGLSSLNEGIGQVTKGLNDMTTASVAEAGSLGAGVLSNVGKLIGNDYLKSFSADQQRLDQIVSNSRQSSPVAGALGKYGTDIAGALGVTGSSVAGLAAGGAAAGLATNTSNNPGTAVVGGAILGAGLGMAGKALSTIPEALGNVARGGRTAMAAASNPEEFSKNVISAAIEKAGGKDITPAGLIKGMNAQWANMDKVKDVLYAARDAAAEDANGGKGISVSREGLSNTLNELNKSSLLTTSPQIKSAILTIKDALQTGVDVPYNIAQQGISNLGKEAASADRAGNTITSSILRQAQDSLNSDIGRALPQGTVISQLHDNATQFMRNIYYPMKDADLTKVVADHASEVKFLSGLTAQSLDNSGPTSYSAMSSMDPTFKAQLIGAHINAIKDSVTQDGSHLDMQKFANSLNKTLKEYSSTDGSNALGAAVAPMRTLANVMSSANMAQKGGGIGLTGLSQSAAGAVAGGMAGGPIGAVGGAIGGQLVSKTPFLYAAGKMLNNPASMDLLHSAGALEAYPKSDMARILGERIIQSFTNQLNDIPLKLMPAFGISKIVGK